MKFGKLDINPAQNPAILDTGTWDAGAACTQLRAAGYDWAACAKALRQGASPVSSETITIWSGSVSLENSAVWFLASLRDGQDCFVRIGRGAADPRLGALIDQWQLSDGNAVSVFPAHAAVIDSYCRLLKPEKGPRALGATPRIGIGDRMTTHVWPGMFDYLANRGHAANAIQNSVRELNLLDDVLEGRPPETNYATNFGMIEAGFTGSTFEGLWVAGVLAALKYERPFRYGADADHLQVKRGPAGVEHAKRLIRASRYYSFFTLDVADVLNYAALNEPSKAAAESFLTKDIPDATERSGVIEHHTRPFSVGGRAYRIDQAELGRFVGKYWKALDTVGDLAKYIVSLKNGVPFDLELTVDEHPPEVAAFDCLTTDTEVLFLAREIRRRGLPITHLAPNFGQEKGYDYRCPDGLAGLESRTRAQFQIASEFELTLDVHSGDDLQKATRQAFGRATGGKVHFKVSPMLPIIFAELLQDYHPELFKRWWSDAVAYARREATAGSDLARTCLAELDSSPGGRPSAKQKVFHYFSFPYVGRRNAAGQFVCRADFYKLSPQFEAAHRDRMRTWLGEIADDLQLK